MFALLRIGGERADRHSVSQIRPVIHLQDDNDQVYGSLEINCERSDKNVFLWLGHEAIWSLILGFLGKLPIGAALPAEFLGYCRMFLTRNARMSYVVECACPEEDGADKELTWQVVGGPFTDNKTAQKMLEEAKKADVRGWTVWFRIVRRLEETVWGE